MIQNKLSRIFRKLEPVTESGCLIWSGCTSEGYGKVSFDNKDHYVHRLVWQLTMGEIPEGKELDHICRVRCCANINHLEIVSAKENVLRGIGVTATNKKKKFCIHGHELPDPNVWLNGRLVGRECVVCKKARRKKRYAEKGT